MTKRGKSIKPIIMLIVISCIGVLCGILMPGNVTSSSAKSLIANESGRGYHSGRYVYYAFEMSGVRMGIMRYDVKTKQKKEIFSYMYEGESNNGFYNISVKGNYIYAEWDLALGTSVSRTYIYRIAKDGSSSKRLAVGSKPVIIGNRIYYEKCKLVKEYGEYVTERTGKWYSMKLDGTDKKKAQKPELKKLWGDGFDNKSIVTIGSDQYYIKDNSLYREQVKTGQVKKLMSCKNGMYDFYVAGSYILVEGTTNKTDKWGNPKKMAAYIIDTEGKNKVLLETWVPAE